MPSELIRLPEWHITEVVTPMSEIYDWSIQFLDLPKLWLETEGEDIRVAILDTGCDVNHPDLKEGIDYAEDFTHSIYGVRDQQGHGTWCAGYIGARANTIGVHGVAAKCRLEIYKVLGDNGAGTEDTILAGINKATERGVDLISMSLGGPRLSERLHQAIQNFTNRGGKFLFAAAGNDGKSVVDYPAQWSECLCIGAVGKDGSLAVFSNRGPRVDVYFPGVEMLSTIPGGRYGTMSGTSMATPGSCAVGALALAKHRKTQSNTPLDTVSQMREHLKSSATLIHGYPVLGPTKLLADIGRVDQPTPPPTEGPNPVAKTWGPFSVPEGDLTVTLKPKR